MSIQQHSPDTEVWGKETGERTKDQMVCVAEESVKAVSCTGSGKGHRVSFPL